MHKENQLKLTNFNNLKKTGPVISFALSSKIHTVFLITYNAYVILYFEIIVKFLSENRMRDSACTTWMKLDL